MDLTPCRTRLYTLCYSAFAWCASSILCVFAASFSNVKYIFWQFGFVYMDVSCFRLPHINFHWLWFVCVRAGLYACLLCIYAFMSESVSLFVYGVFIKKHIPKTKMLYGSRFQTVSAITLTFPIIKNFANNKPNMLRWTLNTHTDRHTHLKELFLFAGLFVSVCVVFVYLIASVWEFDYSIFWPFKRRRTHHLVSNQSPCAQITIIIILRLGIEAVFCVTSVP